MKNKKTKYHRNVFLPHKEKPGVEEDMELKGPLLGTGKGRTVVGKQRTRNKKGTEHRQMTF